MANTKDKQNIQHMDKRSLWPGAGGGGGGVGVGTKTKKKY